MENPNYKPMATWKYVLFVTVAFSSPLVIGLLIIQSEILFRTLALLALAVSAYILFPTMICMIQLKLQDRRKERELRESRGKQGNRR